MTDVTANDAALAHDHDDHGDGHAHPTDLVFVKTAIFLAVVTAAEVGWSYLPWNHATGAKAGVEVGGLLFMMAVKVVVVAGTFMHLKYDKRILTRTFYSGLALAVGVYFIALATFQFFFWNDRPEGFCPADPSPTELSVCEPVEGR